MNKKISFVILFFIFFVWQNVFAITGQEALPRPPANGFSIIIDNNIEITNSKNVALQINGGPDADRMAISTTADFKEAGIVKYVPVIDWKLQDNEGIQNIYVKIYTRFGVASPVFSDSIIYQKPDIANTSKHETITGEVLKVGDLFKINNSSAVYYYAENKKRYVFPTEKVFLSWYSVDDYSNVKIVSQDTLSSINIGGNIVYKHGSTLVKIKSEAKVYAVGFNGKLHWVMNQEVANALYGKDWNKKVQDIPDTLFGNYLGGWPIQDAKNPPDGYIFSLPNSKAVYVVENSKMRPFLNENILKENGYSFDDVKKLQSVDLPIGTTINTKEEKHFDTAQIKKI